MRHDVQRQPTSKCEVKNRTPHVEMSARVQRRQDSGIKRKSSWVNVSWPAASFCGLPSTIPVADGKSLIAEKWGASIQEIMCSTSILASILL